MVDKGDPPEEHSSPMSPISPEGELSSQDVIETLKDEVRQNEWLRRSLEDHPRGRKPKWLPKWNALKEHIREQVNVPQGITFIPRLLDAYRSCVFRAIANGEAFDLIGGTLRLAREDRDGGTPKLSLAYLGTTALPPGALEIMRKRVEPLRTLQGINLDTALEARLLSNNELAEALDEVQDVRLDKVEQVAREISLCTRSLIEGTFTDAFHSQWPFSAGFLGRVHYDGTHVEYAPSETLNRYLGADEVRRERERRKERA